MNATLQSSQLQPSPIDIFTILPHIPPVVGIPLYFNSYKGLTYGYDPTLDVFIPMSYQQLVFIEENYLFHIYNCDFLASEQEFFEDPQDPTFYQRFFAFLPQDAPLCLLPQTMAGPFTSSALAPTSRPNIPGPSTTTKRKATTRRAGGKAAIVGAPTVPLVRRKCQRTPPQDKDPQEWPLLCTFPGCDQRTRDQRDMKRHSKTHEEKGFSCEPYGCKCGTVFTRDDAAKRHAKNNGFVV